MQSTPLCLLENNITGVLNFMRRSHLIWFILALIWTIEDTVMMINHTFSFDLFPTFIYILGIMVTIYEAKMAIQDYKEYKEKRSES